MSSRWIAPHVIGGKDVWSERSLLQRTNPADRDEVVTNFRFADAGEVKAAISAAWVTLKPWQRVPAVERIAICKRVAAMLRAHEQSLALAMVMEVGKTMAGALGEVRKAATVAEFYGSFDPGLFVQSMPSEPGVKRFVLKVPRGVAAIITAFNFPIALAVWKILAAILAGCTVVYKPSELTPYTAYLLMKVFKDAGVPDGVVNLVHGDGSVAEQIIRDPRVQAVSFTGSGMIGARVRMLAAERNIPACCEMGGINKMMILEDWGDRIPQFVGDVIAAAFSATGQRCTSTRGVLIDDSIYEEVVAELLRQMAFIKVGSGIDPTTTMEPLVSETQLGRVLASVDRGIEAGMQVLCGGRRLTGGIYDRGAYMEPTLLTGDPDNSGHVPLHHEVFGPVVTAVRIDGYDDGIRLMNNTTLGHCGSLYTDREDLIERFPYDAEVGMPRVRQHTLGGAADMPFVGMKGSMTGPPEMGVWGVDFFCQTKAFYLDEGKVAVAATTR